MLLFSIVCGFIVGRIRGGKLRGLAELQLRGFWLIIAAFFGKYFLYTWSLEGEASNFVLHWGPQLHMLVYLFLLYVVWVNRRFCGMTILGAGLSANTLVILVNGGRMPVSPTGLERTGLEDYIEVLRDGELVTHTLLGEQTRFGPLADILVIPSPFGGGQVVSIGDLLIFLGVVFLIQQAMVRSG